MKVWSTAPPRPFCKGNPGMSYVFRSQWTSCQVTGKQAVKFLRNSNLQIFRLYLTRMKFESPVLSSVVCVHLHTYDTRLWFPIYLTSWLLPSALEMRRKKSAHFHSLLPPLPLTRFLPSLILTTSSCHPLAVTTVCFVTSSSPPERDMMSVE